MYTYYIRIVYLILIIFSFKNNSELIAYISSQLVHKLPQYAWKQETQSQHHLFMCNENNRRHKLCTPFFLYSFKNNSELSAYISSPLVHKLPQYAWKQETQLQHHIYMCNENNRRHKLCTPFFCTLSKITQNWAHIFLQYSYIDFLNMHESKRRNYNIIYTCVT